MIVQSKYNVGDEIYVSYNMLARYDYNKYSSISVSGPMTLDQDFPLIGIVKEIVIGAKAYGRKYKQAVHKEIRYTIEIQSPVYSVTFKNSPSEYFKTISEFSEEDIFSSIEDMELYMVMKGTGMLQRGWDERELNQLIKYE